MNYKTYQRTLKTLNDKAKQVIKYKVVAKEYFTSDTEFTYDIYIYANNRVIKIIKEPLTPDQLIELERKYDTKIEWDFSNLTEQQLRYLAGEFNKILEQDK